MRNMPANNMDRVRVKISGPGQSEAERQSRGGMWLHRPWKKILRSIEILREASVCCTKKNKEPKKNKKPLLHKFSSDASFSPHCGAPSHYGLITANTHRLTVGWRSYRGCFFSQRPQGATMSTFENKLRQSTQTWDLCFIRSVFKLYFSVLQEKKLQGCGLTGWFCKCTSG